MRIVQVSASNSLSMLHSLDLAESTIVTGHIDRATECMQLS